MSRGVDRRLLGHFLRLWHVQGGGGGVDPRESLKVDAEHCHMLILRFHFTLHFLKQAH